MLNAHTENVDRKNLALIYCKDTSGCSHVRLRYNAEFINGHDMGVIPVLLPYPIFDGQYLARAKSIIFQRAMDNNDLNIIKRYKELQPKFGYKLVAEYDDLIFLTNEINDKDYDGVPLYNPGHDNITKHLPEIMDAMSKIMPYIDLVVVSTPYLKMMFEKVFHAKNVIVIKNVVPRYLWNFERKQNITQDLIKPKVIYSGSPTHYKGPLPEIKPNTDPNCPQGRPSIPGHKGDWNTALCDWVIKNVKENKIDFYIMGALPFFFEPIRHLIKFIPWADSHTFPRKFMEVHADFSIASIVDNPFNRAKSSLRFTEACATGCVFMGNIFNDNDYSPYREIHEECKFKDTSTVEEIDNVFWNLCKKDKYNEVLNWQYDFINTSGCWLESSQHINEMLLMFDNNEQSII